MMIDKGRISAFQMAIMMNPTILATGILLVPAITAKHAKQDLWISPVWGAIIGFLVVYIAFQLNKLYPKESIIEYSEHILGKIPGKILGLYYIFFYLHLNGVVVREYAEFVIGTFLTQTPIIVVMGSMILICALAVYGGIEVLGRASQILVPVVLLLYFLIIVMLIKDLEIKHIFPIMEGGITPSFMGSVVPQGWFSEFILIAFLLPYLTDKVKGLKWGMASVLSVMIFLVLTNITTYMLFGGLTGKFTYPVMVAVRYISIADFLEHLEAIVMAIWVAGTLIKISVFYYVIVLGMSQWLRLSDFRPLVLSVGFLLVVFAIWSARNLQESGHFLSTSATFHMLTVQVGIPIVLLGIARLRKKITQKGGQ